MKLKAAINREVRNGSLRQGEKRKEGEADRSPVRARDGKAPPLQMRLYRRTWYMLHTDRAH